MYIQCSKVRLLESTGSARMKYRKRIMPHERIQSSTRLSLVGKRCGPKQATHKATEDTSKPKRYVLEMFPYFGDIHMAMFAITPSAT